MFAADLDGTLAEQIIRTMSKTYQYQDPSAIHALLRHHMEQLAEELVTDQYVVDGMYLVNAIRYKCFSFAFYFLPNHDLIDSDVRIELYKICTE